MNILVLIKELDSTPLDREIRNGGGHGDIISFYNETGNDYDLIIEGVEYSRVVQACVIFKDRSYYLYIQHGENPNLIKLDVDSIEEINCIPSLVE
ncbi:MAG: hypothetical protein IJH12_02145 [Clostridia bacterium]|nr:hypothetical protein [Clostridia bacterium]